MENVQLNLINKKQNGLEQSKNEKSSRLPPIGNVELMHECRSQHYRVATARVK